jgi:hypothetical protein
MAIPNAKTETEEETLVTEGVSLEEIKPKI